MCFVLTEQSHRVRVEDLNNSIRGASIDLMLDSPNDVEGVIDLKDLLGLDFAEFPPKETASNTADNDIVGGRAPSDRSDR